jgi:hypothetical protein
MLVVAIAAPLKRRPTQVALANEPYVDGFELSRRVRRFEGDRGAFCQIVEPSVAYGVSTKHVGFAVLGDERAGAAVAVYLLDGGVHASHVMADLLQEMP